jgi:hypothetical protein
MMYAREKSDSAIVAGKPTNYAERSRRYSPISTLHYGLAQWAESWRRHEAIRVDWPARDATNEKCNDTADRWP